MTHSFGPFACILTHPSRNLKTSESEMSVLIDDEPPKRRRKGKDEKSEMVRASPQLSRLRVDFDYSALVQKPKRTRQKKEKKEPSKDEETIKRLKVCTPISLYRT